jgi:colanic acid biosynthesis glycosyl transferase WcaI
MRIQIHAINYSPEPTGVAPYVTALAEHLSAYHDVTVITGVPHYPAWKVDPEWRRWRTIELHGRLKIIRLRHYVPSSQGAIRRIVYEGTWVVRAFFEGLRHPADVIVGVVPALFTSPIARASARLRRIRYGLIVQDLMSRAAAQTGIRHGRSLAGFAHTIERAGLHSADGVCTIHARFARVLTDEFGVKPAAVTVIHNWTHIAQPRLTRQAARQRLGWRDDEIIVLHSGNMGLKQGLTSVIDAARLADERADQVRFVLAGGGNQRAALETAGRDVDRLQITGAIPKEFFPDFLQAADILLIHERGGVFEMSLPSKLTSYLAVSRPVVAVTEADSATAELVEATGAGIVIEPASPSALLDTVLKLGDDPERMTALGQSGGRFAESHFAPDHALRAYTDWIEGLAAKR